MLRKKIALMITLFSLGLCIKVTDVNAAPFARTIPVNCSETSKPNAQVNQRMFEFMEKWGIPGASLAIMENNKIKLACGYGWANLEKRMPVMPDSLFRLASVSKTITAMTLLKLVEEGKLHLDDKVFTILSDLKPLNHAKVNPDIYKITVQNLLQMSGGWYSDRPQDFDPTFGPWSNQMLDDLHYQVPASCQTVAQLMMSAPLEFTPGTKFSYSNINYCLLGLLINKVIQQDNGYEAYIKQTILSPLGIQDMQIGSTAYEDKAANEVKYYFNQENNVFASTDRKLDGLPYSKTDLLRKMYSGAGWIATSTDLVKILQALYDNKILNAKSKVIMTQKPTYFEKDNNYPAMGWDEISFKNGKRYISKTGSFTGTNALILQSDKGTSYAILFNIKASKDGDFFKQLRAMLIAMDSGESVHES